MAGDLLDRFRAHLTGTGLFDPPGPVMLAVSGGGDSLALLELMVRVGPGMGLELQVGHVDHGMGADSARVADAVRRAAEGHDVPYWSARLEMGPDGSETRARDARYEALDRFRAESGATYLATAHHADDQVETVLFRVLRGSAPSGLAGIAPRRVGNLVRPLLPFRRAELRDWLTSTGTATPFSDPANLDFRHERAWIRHELLPMLRARSGDVDDRILDLSGHAAADRRAWAELLHALPGLDLAHLEGAVEVARPVLQTYDTPLRQAILRAAAFEIGCVLGPARAERLARFVATAESGRRFEIGSGWACEVAFDRIRIFSVTDTPPPAPVAWGAETAGRVTWGEWSLTWRREPAGAIRRDGWTTWVTPGSGMIRPPRPGDKLVPLGGLGRRPVARLLMEGRVVRGERPDFPVVVRGEEILWLPGLCRANTARPAPGTESVRLDASLG